jgi:hypothetical protein
MRTSPRYVCNGATRRCTVCDGKFGLTRRYCWNRTPFEEVRRTLHGPSKGYTDGYADFRPLPDNGCGKKTADEIWPTTIN